MTFQTNNNNKSSRVCAKASLYYFVTLFCILLLQQHAALGFEGDWASLDLPQSHIPYHIKQSSQLRQRCGDDCPYADLVKTNRCWGYERNCKFENSYSYDMIKCSGQSNWPNAQTLEDQRRLFWSQGDFGYLNDRMNDMTTLCSSKSSEGSNLKCSDHLRYCYGKNIFIDFKDFKAKTSTNKYREDLIQEGDIGGNCDKKFNREVIKYRSDHKSPLQSWAAELLPFEHYENFQVDQEHCDIIYSKPTVVIKLDASVSMYHHFCDFVNLYASQHINGSFNRDINIVLWDTSAYGFMDGMFGVTWQAFTSNPLIQLKDLDGKKVCFKSVMMPLLARQRFGFYYNMPVLDVCQGSGFFQSFSMQILHRLKVPQNGPVLGVVRVTLLARSTEYRRMLNEPDLVGALKTLRNVRVRHVDYNSRMPFRDQLEMTHNTDLLIGMHGYHCGDRGCYYDLSRLRGITYRTWENENKVFPQDEGHHPTLGAHKKFTNYRFDVPEFIRIVEQLLEAVRSHPKFVQAQKQIQQQSTSQKSEL